MADKTILLVEDDPKDIELTKYGFQEHNLTDDIVVTTDGTEALNYLFYREKYEERKKGDPVLILLDIKMPKVDGLEVLHAIKSDPNLKTIPVVMMTSSEEEQDIVESYQKGANAYVVKPVAFEAFMQAVKSIGLFWLKENKTAAEH